MCRSVLCGTTTQYERIPEEQRQATKGQLLAQQYACYDKGASMVHSADQGHSAQQVIEDWVEGL